MTVTTTNGTAAQTEASETDKRILAELARKQRVSDLRARGWKVELSGGHHAVLSDPELLPERKARAIKVAMIRSVRADGRPDPELTIDGGYVVIAAFLRSWTYELPVPTADKTDAILELPSRDVAALATATSDLREEAFVDYSTDTPEALADPSSPLGVGGG